MNRPKVPHTAAGLSLTRKVLLVIIPVFICFFLIVGYITESVLEGQIINNMEEAVSVLAQDEAKDIDAHFKRLEALGSKSADMVKKWLKRRPDPPDRASFDKKYKQVNGALRTNVDAFFNEDVSVAFLSNRTKINDEIRQIIAATEEPFDNYAKGVIPTVFTMWLITRHQMGRSYEKDWTLEVEPDHDFTKDIFYYTADPVHNPEAHVKWTQPYYDSIWKHWMTSVVAPVYIDDRFLGVVGHDVVLDEVYAKILNQKYFKSGYGFIFDHGKNIVVHPKYLDRLLKSAEMGTLLSTSDLGDPELSRVIAKIAGFNTPERRLNYDRFLAEGEIQYLFAYKLDFLDWYFAIVLPEQEILKMLPQYRRDFFRGATGASLMLLLIVITIIWLSVIKPINTLTKTASEIRMGDLDKTVDIKSRDEIGQLSKAFNEMTGRLKTQMKEIKTAEEKYRSIFENAVEGIFQTTPGGRFISTSPSMASLLGYKDSDDLMKSVSNLARDLYVDPAQRGELIRRFDASDTVSGFETRFYKKDGGTLWVSLNVRAARDARGRVSYLEGFLSDITERKQAQEALFKLNKELDQRVVHRTAELAKAKEAADKAREKAEVANLAKSTFLANMSHELRTPLNAILGYSQLMQRDSRLHTRQEEYLGTINRSGEHLLALINDVLEISRIEAGRVRIAPVPFDLKQFLSDLEMMLKVQADAKKLYLNTIVAEGVPSYAVCDENKFRQILINLLGNAVKFTHEGGIEMRVSATGKYEDTCLIVEVADTGTGIVPEEAEKVFESFEQTQSGRGVSGGTGLGLAISREYARLMGGDITFDSLVGKGSTFRLELNIREAQAADLTAGEPRHRVAALAQPQQIPRILIADDDDDSRTLLMALLKGTGFKVRGAKDGREAVAAFSDWDPGFIWMDIRMPVMDGLEATRQIRAMPSGKGVVIAALTAHALDDKQEDILAAGCDDFLSKPYREHEIFEVMANHLGVSYLYEEAREPPALPKEMTSEQLTAILPKELRNRLHQAVLRLDQAMVLKVLAEIKVLDPSIGEALASCASRFDFERLMALLEIPDSNSKGEK